MKIAVTVPEEFFTMPELYGGGIVHAYKIYEEQLSRIPFVKIRFYLYHLMNKALYLVDLVRNLVNIIRDEIDVIVSPCEAELSVFMTLTLGIASRKPIAIVFNTIPLTGEVGYGLSFNEKDAFKYIVKKCCDLR